MRKDYHMHPMIIQKPERFQLFVKKALEEGIEEICITDHMPLLCSTAKDRIPHGKVEEYCKTVRELAEIYKSDISIKLGIEVDFHPSVLDEVKAVLQAGEFDYVLGSSHLHVVREKELFDGKMTRNQYARLMFENTIRAAESGYFHAVAHLDMFRWIFSCEDRYPLQDDHYSPELHRTLIEETLDAIKENSLRMELNPHFAEKTQRLVDVYPDIYIVQRALDKGILFSYGSDAHAPESVGALLIDLEEHPVYSKALATWQY